MYMASVYVCIIYELVIHVNYTCLELFGNMAYVCVRVCIYTDFLLDQT